MTIREIEALSGMTRANIRFYEAEGLLNPAREENGYRDYSEEDLEILKRIRLFRTLQFSLAEIKALQSGDETLSQALEKRLQELMREHQDLDRAGETCRVMREEQAEYSTLDAQRYLDVYERVARLPGNESVKPVGISDLHDDAPVSAGISESLSNASAAGDISGMHSGIFGQNVDQASGSVASVSGASKEGNRAIDEYTRTLDQPSWMRDDTVEPVRAPWRRFFARQLDLAVYGFCLNAILMLVFHINPERISSETQIGNLTFSVAWLSVLALVIMLFVEPLFLAVFATTPGKW
ncbi:MAG: MerR family transcriptional regulator, partial [Lachnospiraceae bacterium]|nr:MerR family transcriptional regulator [Lachnospiraceae bacterium]